MALVVPDGESRVESIVFVNEHEGHKCLLVGLRHGVVQQYAVVSDGSSILDSEDNAHAPRF